ncbi:NAD(P)-dependent oxidoreductase [Streptomyces albicerus]|uniref:hypothetical protein n=1 Tax=Streptomyces albicerus TaxID=2569859 RepID=UPI00124B1E84|nr:hypothetical protein [Streptomyces albicerus]
MDWTLVYSVLLTNGLGTCTCTYGTDKQIPMKGMPKISRADVVGFMLSAAAGTDWTHRTAVLSN